MTSNNKPRVFIGPHEIAGYYANLAKGFNAIGVDCDYITYTPHPFVYGGETYSPLLIRLAQRCNQLRRKPNRHLVLRALYALSGKILIAIWSIFALFHYDVFIFGFGQSLLRNNIDLPILRWLKKTVISNIAHGAEARPTFICGANQSKEGVFHSIDQINSSNQKVKQLVIKHEQNATVVIGSPFSTSQFAESRFINSFALGIPFITNNSQNIEGIPNTPFTTDLDNDNVSENHIITPIRILHSPSHPAAKGSPIIIQAVENLIRRGYQIDFVLLHGRPFSEVLSEIQRCDFVVDQVYSDTPMAGFATEAAWFGKPAVVGGYGLEYLKTFVPKGMWPPSKTCKPNEIEQAIESLIVNQDERLRLGAEAQKFVQEKWLATKVAKRYLCIIEGDIPNDWWLDPHTVTYLEGAGQTVERTRENIWQIVERYGVDALQLSHRPNLERAFLEFAGITHR